MIRASALMFGLAVLLGLVGQVEGKPILYQFDVDGFGSPASETQSGFIRMTEAGMTGNAANGAFTATGKLPATK